MKIELKNLKLNLTFSQETIMFQADVYVDGVKTAYAGNDGHGGCTSYNAYAGKRDLLAKAEEYAKSLPSIKYGTITIQSNLELVIDELLNEEVKKREQAKHERKIEKLCLNHFVWGVPNGVEYSYLSFKGKPMFDTLLQTPQGRASVYNAYLQVKSKLKKGEVIFNKNLPFT